MFESVTEVSEKSNGNALFVLQYLFAKIHKAQLKSDIISGFLIIPVFNQKFVSPWTDNCRGQ